MTIEVTEDDIKRGIRRSASNCPIANAARRMGIVNVHISRSIFYFNEEHYLCSDEEYGSVVGGAPLPNAAFEFIMYFDNGVPVCPITFEIQAEPLYISSQEQIQETEQTEESEELCLV